MWRSEVDISDISDDFGLLFIESVCLNQLHIAALVLLASLFWGNPCLPSFEAGITCGHPSSLGIDVDSGN